MTPEQEIDVLKYQISELKNRIQELERENQTLSNELDAAQWEIKTKLEPRIKEEKARYDRWVLNQGVE